MLVALRAAFDGPDQLYAYAIGVLAGRSCSSSMTLPRLHRYGFRLTLRIDLRDPRLRRVLG